MFPADYEASRWIAMLVLTDGLRLKESIFKFDDSQSFAIHHTTVLSSMRGGNFELSSS